MPLEKGEWGVGPLPFHSTVHQTQVYFVIVLHTYNTRENSLHKIVSALVLFSLSFVYEPFTTVYKTTAEIKTVVARLHFHNSSCGIAFKSITSFLLSLVLGYLYAVF